MVEHRLPKPGVEGSNPFSRSNIKRRTIVSMRSVCPKGAGLLKKYPQRVILSVSEESS